MEYSLENLLEDINIQDSIKEKVLRIDSEIDYSNYQSFILLLSNSNTHEEGYIKLKEYLNADYHQFKMLTIQLETARRLYNKYLELGIDKDIYTATFSCFTRFINECKVKTGEYYFDRGWWTHKQLGLTIFRIGTFEFEFLDNKKISLHIPSNATLTKNVIDESLTKAKEFIKQFKQEYINSDILCHSWLLYPGLSNLLDSNSNIIQFQKRFNIIKVEENTNDYKEWIFKINVNENIEIKDYKEDTSLQRNAKKYLLEDNTLGVGLGILK